MFVLAPLTGVYGIRVHVQWGVLTAVLDWLLSSMLVLVLVIAAFLRVVFWFVDESQGLVRLRTRSSSRSHWRRTRPPSGTEDRSPRHPDSGPGGLSAHHGLARSRIVVGLSMHRTTILFVDDDDDFIRGAYGDLLREEGFSVVEAADG